MLRTSAQGSSDENDLVEVEHVDLVVRPDVCKSLRLTSSTALRCDQVVAPLVDVHKIHPLKSSKTELGSDCKA